MTDEPFKHTSKGFHRFLIPVAVIAAFVIASIARSAPADVTGAGKKFVELLVKEDFAGAVAQCDDTMKTALPESKLRETWQTIQHQAGIFQKQISARQVRQAGYDIVFVTCEFKQATLDVKVVFDAQKRVAGLFFVPSRPATTDSGPPPYARTNAFRETKFTVGKGEWQLPGTLTTPTSGNGPWPALVLVHGSGPNDRDETVGANKPFRDLAWGLATRGVAVLRYEKRTREHGARFAGSGIVGLTVKEESIDDAVSAAAQLRATAGIDPKRVFILGHSLGGTVAPRIGQADAQIAGLIFMAGSTRLLEDLIVEQTKYLISLDGKPSAEGEARLAEVQSAAARIKQLTAADASSSKVLFGAAPAYWLDMRAHDPLAVAKLLKQPLLILQGARDYQVTLVDFNRWKDALGGQPNVIFKLYPKLNHLFIAGEGKSRPDEYEQPEHVAEAVVTDIAEWIKQH